MIVLEQHLKQAEQKNADLSARLDVRERINTALLQDLEAQNRALRKEHEGLQQQLQQLQSPEPPVHRAHDAPEEELAWFKAQVYGRSSEKSSADISPDQFMLFNEPEVLAAIAAAIGSEADAVITIEAYERHKKPGKKSIPADLPRVPVIHDIAESEKICAHDGTALEVIGYESAERYDYVAPKLQVLEDRRPKYGRRCCRQALTESTRLHTSRIYTNNSRA